MSGDLAGPLEPSLCSAAALLGRPGVGLPCVAAEWWLCALARLALAAAKACRGPALGEALAEKLGLAAGDDRAKLDAAWPAIGGTAARPGDAKGECARVAARPLPVLPTV